MGRKTSLELRGLTSEENTKRIKREYYERNRLKVIERSAIRRKRLQTESGWKPREPMPEGHLQAYQKAWRANPKNKARIKSSIKRYRMRSPDVQKNGHLKRKYGITISVYKELFQNQGGLCAICKKPENNKDLAVDHCHKTKKVRGLLCFKCNASLGKFEDSIELLQNAISYLETNK